MGLPIIGLVVSVAGSFIQGAMTANAATQQAKAENAQLKIDMENERIKGMQEQSDRQEAYLRAESENRVAIAVASGGGRNFAYDEGLGVYNKEVVRRDLATAGFNTGQKIGRMAYQIKVNTFNAKTKATSAFVDAGLGALGSITNYASRPGGMLA